MTIELLAGRTTPERTELLVTAPNGTQVVVVLRVSGPRGDVLRIEADGRPGPGVEQAKGFYLDNEALTAVLTIR